MSRPLISLSDGLSLANRTDPTLAPTIPKARVAPRLVKMRVSETIRIPGYGERTKAELSRIVGISKSGFNHRYKQFLKDGDIEKLMRKSKANPITIPGYGTKHKADHARSIGLTGGGFKRRLAKYQIDGDVEALMAPLMPRAQIVRKANRARHSR